MIESQHLHKDQIQAKLKTRVFGRNLIVLGQVGSTNDVARDLAAQGASEGTVVVADEQSAGRGRLGRKWISPAGQSLLCSVLFRPHIPPAKASWITMLAALAMADAVVCVAALEVELKWPNDLIVAIPRDADRGAHWRKVAGVLTETAVEGGELKYVIVGIGVNVNVPRGYLNVLAQDATSILAEVGHTTLRADLLAAFLSGVEVRYERLQKGAAPRQEWASRLATLGRRVETTGPGGLLVGVAESVDQDGNLLLRTDDGLLHTLAAGDVTLARRDARGS